MTPHIAPEALAEVAAFAARSGIEQEQLLTANGAADIMQLADLGNLFGCSTFVVTPARSTTSHMIVGRNLDYPDSQILRSYWQPVVFARKGKLRILSIHVPGLSGVLTGINEKGVFLAIKVSHTGNSTSDGMPAAFAFRSVLEQATTGAEAVALYSQIPRTVPLNVTIVDPSEAYEFESDSTAFAVRRPSPSTRLLYGANHFESTEMPGGGPQGRDYRWPTLSRYDATREPLGFAEVKSVIADAGGFVEGPTGPSTNVLATFVEYGATLDDTVVTMGSDPVGNGIAANGPLRRIRLGDAFATPATPASP
jgi:hypothetical protein